VSSFALSALLILSLLPSFGQVDSIPYEGKDPLLASHTEGEHEHELKTTEVKRESCRRLTDRIIAK
jgi:hypothetical protein